MNPNKNSGMQRLRAFVPRAGTDYARSRNYDFGPDNRSNVSGLSPWLRHRLVTEQEVLNRVLAQHSAGAAEKFVQEVCWRTYWKGWLEMRPGVWDAYIKELLNQGDLSGHGAKRFEQAVKGGTGIECFDYWCHELCSTGYLHNHARMWFASIWIFTLQLPWSQGADFFMRHLIDGDAASNTLSWRWVAGLQTPGKTYLARADNIAKFTDGRFPATPGLAALAQPLFEDTTPAVQSLPSVHAPLEERNSAWLIVDDDLSLEQFAYQGALIDEALILDTVAWRSVRPISEKVSSFVEGATADAVQRLNAEGTRLTSRRDCTKWVSDLIEWCRSRSVDQLLCPYLPVGPSRDALGAASKALSDADIHLAQLQREWDRAAWPYATKGFFRFKKQIPQLLNLCVAESLDATASRPG